MPMIIFLKRSTSITFFKFFALIFLLLIYNKSHAQSQNGVVKGHVIDGSSKLALYGVNISIDDAAVSDSTQADGSFIVKNPAGTHSITFERDGFQSKKISDVNFNNQEISSLSVVLFPIAVNAKSASKDSITTLDTIFKTTYLEEQKAIFKSKLINLASLDFIPSQFISPSTDKNLAFILKRLSGVSVLENPDGPQLQSLTIKGLGERYNQLSLNGMVLTTLDPTSRSFALDVIPAEAIENVSVSKMNDASIPADFAGGSVNIKTSELPDRNFYYAQFGGSYSDNTTGKAFFGDKRNTTSWYGLPNSKATALPSEFPTNQSRTGRLISQKNLQEQVRLSKLLKNNLSPQSFGRAPINDKAILGFGRNITLKGGQKIGVTSFVYHKKSELIDELTVQAVPSAANKFPFTDTKTPVVQALAQDTRYRYSADLGAVLNGSISFGRNKISVKNLFGSLYTNSYTERNQYAKPDQDTIAQKGFNYLTDVKQFLITQVSGVHALGSDGKFKVDWNAGYSLNTLKNPDERNFMLRQNTGDPSMYEIAGGTGFTNSSRLWRSLKDNSFSGSLDMQVPINIIHQAQVISGGISVQLRNRDFNSDILLFAGKGYHKLEEVLSPENYYPGGKSVLNFDGATNYTASSNIGASYVKLASHILDNLFIDAGLRIESSSNLVSIYRYDFIKGFKNPRQITKDQNMKVIDYSLLPSFRVKYNPATNMQFWASYFKSVNRPQLQELSSYQYYDVSSFTVRTGNTNAANTDIQNYDMGALVYSNTGLNFSVSAFYKKINQPLEYVLSPYASANYLATLNNMPPATVKGIETAVKSNLSFAGNQPWLAHTTIFASAIFLKTKVQAGHLRSVATPETVEHSLSGSPDFTLNSGLTINQPKFPQLSLLYNRTSDYISAVGSGVYTPLSNGNRVLAVPNYQVKGRDLFNIQLSQEFYKSKARLIAGINNVLNSSYTVYQDLNGNNKFDDALLLKANANGRLGYYQSGTDNTVVAVKSQRLYYLTLSYLFNK